MFLLCDKNFKLTKDETKALYNTLFEVKDTDGISKRDWTQVKNKNPYVTRIVLDIDIDLDKPNALEHALKITNEIINTIGLKHSLNAYFSGKKGFHIEYLTKPLDIIDTTVNKPSESCPLYTGFLRYWNNKYPEVDVSLGDGATRPFRIHGTKHPKSGMYKILINPDSTMDEIISCAKLNNDMVEPCKSKLSKKQARNLLNTYNLPVETIKNTGKSVITPISNTLYSDVFNALLKAGYHRHEIIGRLGASLNGYLSVKELEAVYQELVENTSIEDSINSHQSIIDALENDSQPCNMGQLRNLYTDGDLDKKIPLNSFIALSNHLKDKVNKESYDKFMNMLKFYDGNILDLLQNELWDYVDNTENMFKGIIHGVGAGLGIVRRELALNGGSESGKSEYQDKLGKSLPNYEYLGNSTPSSIRRNDNPRYYDGKVIGLSDKGLEATSENNNQEMNEHHAFYGELVSEGEYKRDLTEGGKVRKFNFEVTGMILIYSQPYTNTRTYKAGDQIATRTTYITVNPVKNPEELVLKLKHNSTNKFYQLHNEYVDYIFKNPITITVPDEIDLYVLRECNKSLRTYKYMMGLFNAYCVYLNKPTPSINDAEEFMSIFKPNIDVNDIELALYNMLRRNLMTADPEKIESDDYLVYDYNSDLIPNRDDMITQRKDRNTKTLFTPRQVKTYFREEFKHNPNLKDVTDDVSGILSNLFKAGYIGMLEQKYKGENVYYILPEIGV